MSLTGSHWCYFDTRYQVTTLMNGANILLFLFLFDTARISQSFWLIAALLRIISGNFLGYVFFDWNSQNDIEIESEEDRKERIAEQRSLIDFSSCMSCTKPI